jgi:hypothetical protein
MDFSVFFPNRRTITVNAIGWHGTPQDPKKTETGFGTAMIARPC